MDKLLVLVNGLPGSGKSTLGRSVAAELGAEFLSKDGVKEALAGRVGDVAIIRALGGIAMDAVWAMARETRGPVVIDSWWFKPRDLHFARIGIEKTQTRRVVEIWCDVPAEIARARYVARCRNALLYQEEQHLTRDWQTWAEQASPLGLAPVIPVNTTEPVDYVELAAQIQQKSVI